MAHPLPYLDTAKPRILAHRGLATEAPENTLAAFRAAIAAGATHLETDVHASRDGIAVLSHDPDLSRLTGRAERVGDLTLSELQAIDLGGGERFVALGDALAALPAARFNIDVKDARAVRPTAEAVLAASAVDRVLITSFSGRRRRATCAMLPGVATSADGLLVVATVLTAGIPRVLQRVLRGVAAIQVPERSNGLAVVTPRVIRAVHALGVEVHVWTINSAADMVRLLDLGVDGIVTDRTDIAAAIVVHRS